jgi:CheY-like chemotaxis protein
MSRKRALVVDDNALALQLVCDYVQELGDYVIDPCGDAETAVNLLEKLSSSEDADNYSLVLVDMRLRESKDAREAVDWAGAHLLFRISREFPHTRNLVLYTTTGAAPSVGDMDQVLRARASALTVSSDESAEKFKRQLAEVLQGAMVVSAHFRSRIADALDPEKQCPFDPVQYYCISLICEHRTKKQAEEKWAEIVGGATENNIDDLLGEIYPMLDELFPERKNHDSEDSGKSAKEMKSYRLCQWYNDTAIEKWGPAYPIPYDTAKQRRMKYGRGYAGGRIDTAGLRDEARPGHSR